MSGSPAFPFPLPRRSPEELGIPTAALVALTDRLQTEGLDPHALVIARGGQIAFETAWAPYRLDRTLAQLRAAAHIAGGPDFLLDIPAGLLEGDAPHEAIRREAMEETGYFVGEAHHLFDFFASPGTLTEKVALFAAFVSASDRVMEGGGLEEEHEYIEVVELKLDEAFAMISSGEIVDAKTIMALQWAMLARPALNNAHIPG